MDNFSNPSLFKIKKQQILKFEKQDKNLSIPFSIRFEYHGIQIFFSSDKNSLIKGLQNFIPQLWQYVDRANIDDKNVIQIFHRGPSSLNMGSEEFCDEDSSDCWTDIDDNRHMAIQRDFAAIEKGDIVYGIFDYSIDDGLYNFFRWLLSRRLLKMNKAILHSSCILDHDGQAVFFLGPSGAGKTTISTLCDERFVFGDDMNTILLVKDRVYAQAGLVGGAIEAQVEIDKIYPVKAAYWIVQDKEFAIHDCSHSLGLQYYLASLANLFWDQSSQELQENSLKFCAKLQDKMPIQKLLFRPEKRLWDYVK